MRKRLTPLPFPATGGLVKYYRTVNKLTQEELAGLIGMSPSYLSCVELGTQMPSITYLYKLSQALSVPIERLLVDNGKQEITGIKDVLKRQIDYMDEEEAELLHTYSQVILPKMRLILKRHME